MSRVVLRTYENISLAEMHASQLRELGYPAIAQTALGLGGIAPSGMSELLLEDESILESTDDYEVIQSVLNGVPLTEADADAIELLENEEVRKLKTFDPKLLRFIVLIGMAILAFAVVIYIVFSMATANLPYPR
jgi:hypothetical protein